MDFIGKKFAERYEIIEEIGHGGMATIYKAKDVVLGRFVAVKILKQEFLGDEEFTNRFTAEAQAAAALSSQNLVAIYDVGTYLGNNYIVMEFVDGITLKEYIKQKAPLEWKEAVVIATQVLQGISHAHKRGIVHRDIKPQNIMLTRAGIAKVMDFGIARATSSHTMKIGDTTIGSVHYFSPEQARGKHTDERSDIYSLGVVLYEMLTGKLPFDGDSPISVAMMHLQQIPENPKDINIAIPLAINDIVQKAMRKETSERYQTAEELWKDLNDALSNPDISPVRENTINSDETRIMTPLKPLVRMKEDEEAIFTEPQEYVPHTRKVRRDLEKKQKQKPKEREEIEEKYEEKSKKLNKVAKISFSVLGVLILFVIAYALFPGWFQPHNTMEVPNLVGQNITDVQSQYNGNKNVKITAEQTDDTSAQGTILSQDPESGISLRTPIAIKVGVSNGPQTMTLPDYTGKDQNTVSTDLENMGLKVTTTSSSSPTTPEGIVMQMSPTPGSTVKTGDTITITVSSGSQGAQIMMPGLIGMKSDDAITALKNVNLYVGAKTYQDSNYDADVVISQSVAKGSTITEYSTVDLVISTGKAPSTATPAPPTTYSGTIKVTIPQTAAQTTIKVLVGGKTVYDGTCNATDKTLSVPITSTNKQVTAQIYFNGILQQTVPVALN